MMPAVPSKDGVRRRADTASPPVPSKHDHGGFSSRMANAFRRGGNERSEQRKRDKEAKAATPTASARTDVIDRLDLSGLGTSLFHHDSPYDACSPHSNRNARRAPVKAFDYQDPAAGGSRPADASGSGSGRPGLSPLAAATMRKMSDNAADVEKEGRMQSSTTIGSGRSRSGAPVPVLGRNAAAATPSEVDSADAVSLTEQSAVDRDVDTERQYQYGRGYMAQPSNVSRGRADVSNPMADIWGVTSEPWQDFAAPTATKQKKTSRKQALGVNNGADSSSDDLASAASSVFDMEAVMTGKAPQRLPREDTSKGTSSPLATNGDGNGPKRSKSLLKRIRSARQNPNVPPPDAAIVSTPPADSDAQYLANNNSHSTDSGAGASGRPGGAVRYADQRPKPARARTHQHSPSMPMHVSPPLQAGEGGLSANGRSASGRMGSGSNSNGYLATPPKDTYNGSTPRDRSVSVGGTSNGSNNASNTSSTGGGNLQRGNSIFGRLRGKNRAQAAAAR